MNLLIYIYLVSVGMLAVQVVVTPLYAMMTSGMMYDALEHR
jgi:hypothetical protein